MERISSTTAFFMTAIAVIFDLLSLIPIVGTVTGILASMVFGIWFSHHGVSLLSKRTFSFLMTSLAEYIPIVEMAPFWTFFVWWTIQKERTEEAI